MPVTTCDGCGQEVTEANALEHRDHGGWFTTGPKVVIALEPDIRTMPTTFLQSGEPLPVPKAEVTVGKLDRVRPVVEAIHHFMSVHGCAPALVLVGEDIATQLYARIVDAEATGRPIAGLEHLQFAAGHFCGQTFECMVMSGLPSVPIFIDEGLGRTGVRAVAPLRVALREALLHTAAIR